MANEPKRLFFPKVKEAREALRERALDLLNKYETIIDLAIAKGDFEVAGEHVQWLLEHMPAEDGDRLIDPSAATVKEVASGPVGPSIQIGIALTSPKPKELAPVVIEAEVVKPKELPAPIEPKVVKSNA